MAARREIEKFIGEISQFNGVMGDSYKYLATHAKFYESIEPTPDQLEIAHQAAKLADKTPGQCYFNAQTLMSRMWNKRITYCEGIVFSCIVPLDHGWCLIDDTIVLDFSLPIDFERYQTKEEKGQDPKWIDNRVIGHIPDNWAYYGIPIDRKEVLKYWHKTEMAGPILSTRFKEELDHERRRRIKN